jgi:hypothetical protein
MEASIDDCADAGTTAAISWYHLYLCWYSEAYRPPILRSQCAWLYRATDYRVRRWLANPGAAAEYGATACGAIRFTGRLGRTGYWYQLIAGTASAPGGVLWRAAQPALLSLGELARASILLGLGYRVSFCLADIAARWANRRGMVRARYTAGGLDRCPHSTGID